MLNADPSEDAEKHNLRGNFSGGRLQPYHGPTDYVAVQASSLPKIAIAIVCYMYTVDMEAAAKGYDWSVGGWCSAVVLRDIFLMIAVAGVWDWILYFSPLKDRLAPYKFNSQYPKNEQLARDLFWTTSATLLASAQEILLMRWWASGKFKAAMFGTPPAGESVVPYNPPFFGTDTQHPAGTPVDSSAPVQIIQMR
eukprot:SAG11_NODE_584_length_8351_cov_159.783568_2_plen_195_part_00